MIASKQRTLHISSSVTVKLFPVGLVNISVLCDSVKIFALIRKVLAFENDPVRVLCLFNAHYGHQDANTLYLFKRCQKAPPALNSSNYITMCLQFFVNRHQVFRQALLIGVIK